MPPPDQKPRVVPAFPMKAVFLDRKNFNNQFDAEVDRGKRIVTLIMSLDFTMVGWGNTPQDYVSKVAQTFMTDMKDVVQKAWSGQYGVQWQFDSFPDKYKARVEVVLDGKYAFSRPCPAHVQIGIHPNTPGARSCAGGGGGGLQESDNIAKEHVRQLLPDAKAKTPKDYMFYQITTVHEFGHMMGLDHIAGKGNEPRDYGMTPDLARDIMGSGSIVSQRDYEPFLRIMKRYGEDNLPQGENKWKLVAAE